MNTKDIPALKATNQNLMRSNLTITDRIYGILSDMDVRSEILNFGKPQKDEDVLRMVRKLLQQKGFLISRPTKGLEISASTAGVRHSPSLAACRRAKKLPKLLAWIAKSKLKQGKNSLKIARFGNLMKLKTTFKGSPTAC